MKRIFLLASAAMLTATTTFAQKDNIKSIEIGTSMPLAKASFNSVTTSATTLEKEMTDEGLLVMFSCNTCPYVVKSQARTKEMLAYAKNHHIGVVVVNSNEAKRDADDSPEAMKKYAKEHGYDKVPYLIDNESTLANAFGATRTPEVFLFNPKGELIYKGAMEDNPANPSESKEMFLKAAMDDMMSGNTPDPNSTKSIGCTIKRAS